MAKFFSPLSLTSFLFLFFSFHLYCSQSYFSIVIFYLFLSPTTFCQFLPEDHLRLKRLEGMFCVREDNIKWSSRAVKLTLTPTIAALYKSCF